MGVFIFKFSEGDICCVPAQDIGDKQLAYDMMAKLALAAAEEHVGRPAKDAGIVVLYAKVGETRFPECQSSAHPQACDFMR